MMVLKRVWIACLTGVFMLLGPLGSTAPAVVVRPRFGGDDVEEADAEDSTLLVSVANRFDYIDQLSEMQREEAISNLSPRDYAEYLGASSQDMARGKEYYAGDREYDTSPVGLRSGYDRIKGGRSRAPRRDGIRRNFGHYEDQRTKNADGSVTVSDCAEPIPSSRTALPKKLTAKEKRAVKAHMKRMEAMDEAIAKGEWDGRT